MERWILLGGMLGGIGLMSLAQTVPSQKSALQLFENATIVPQFRPNPIVLRGISGGTTETQKFSLVPKTDTGECIGFIDQTPDHELTLAAPFAYLRLAVRSSGDTVLLVKGPGGVWCSDDVTDRNPLVEGQWLPGKYQLWVGSYEQNASHPYILQITELENPPEPLSPGKPPATKPPQKN